MSSNYIKISQLPDAKDSLTIADNKLPANLFLINCDTISLNEVSGCLIQNCLVPDNTIKLSLAPNATEFSIDLTPLDYNKINEIYYELNDIVMGWRDINYNTFSTVENNKLINEITLSSCAYNKSKKADRTSLVQSDDTFTATGVIKEIKINNTPISMIELNNSSTYLLDINNCDNLKSCILGDFTEIGHITINNTNCFNNIKIGKVASLAYINLENNQFKHIEIHGIGDSTILNKNRCKIIKQKNGEKLNSVCFINCNVTEDLLDELTGNNVRVYNLKRAV